MTNKFEKYERELQETNRQKTTILVRRRLRVINQEQSSLSLLVITHENKYFK